MSKRSLSGIRLLIPVFLSVLLLLAGCGDDKVLEYLNEADESAWGAADDAEWLRDRLDEEGVSQHALEDMEWIIYQIEEVQMYIELARESYLERSRRE